MDMKKDMNIMGIIGIIGAVILIVGVFLTWMTTAGIPHDINWSGWQVYNKDGALDLLDMKYTFVPLVALICGIIALILMIVPTFMNTEKFAMINNILGLVTLIMAIVVVVCGLLWYTQSWTSGSVTVKLTDFADIGIGFWLTIVGGIITLIGGIMPILKNKGIINF